MRGDKQKLINHIRGKKVAYIATKNSDYIRVSQEVSLVRENADEVLIITSNKNKYISRLLDVYKRILITDFHNYDIIFIGFMAQMILPWFKPKFQKAQIIEDFFISIYDTLTDDRKKFSPQSLAGRMVHWIDKLALKSADIIISDTNIHGRYFQQEFGITGKEILTLYLEADPSIFYRRTVEKPIQWNGKFIVLYFGSILPVQGVDIVLDAINSLKFDNRFQFVIIGPIGKKLKKVKTDNITYIEWLSQNDLAKMISLADLCLGGHFSLYVEKANRTIPGKVYIYESMNKPIIFGDSDANRELFHEDDKHKFVSRGHPEILANAIMDFRGKYAH